jgi:hypothetical protein
VAGALADALLEREALVIEESESEPVEEGG